MTFGFTRWVTLARRSAGVDPYLTFLCHVTRQVESKDVTLDDLWKLDLVKLDGWTCVRENSVGQELLEDDEWGTDDDNEEEEVDSTTPDLA